MSPTGAVAGSSLGPLLGIWIGALIGLSGCPDARVPPPDDLLTEVAAVDALMASRLDGLRSLAAYARVSYYGDDGARKGRVSILARRPSDSHFMALTPTDDMLAVLATDGQRFTSFERGAEICYRGPACPENVGRLLPLALPPGDVTRLLLGGAPAPAHASATVAWDARVGAYHLVREVEGGIQNIWVAHGTGDVLRTTVRRGGATVVEVDFEDVRVVAGQRLPHVLRVRMTEGDVDLRIVYRDVDVNVDLADDAFQLDCPAGMTEATLPCEPSP